MPKQRESSQIDIRPVIATIIIILMVTSCFVLIMLDRNCNGSESSPEPSDCVRGAPEDCVRSSIEMSKQRDFHGYVYCACFTASGAAKGYIAADSSIYRVDDTGARATRSEPLGNDNPAVTFPVGAPHR